MNNRGFIQGEHLYILIFIFFFHNLKVFPCYLILMLAFISLMSQQILCLFTNLAPLGGSIVTSPPAITVQVEAYFFLKVSCSQSTRASHDIKHLILLMNCSEMHLFTHYTLF